MSGPSLVDYFDPAYSLRSMHTSELQIPVTCNAYTPDNSDDGACRIIIQPAPELGAPTWTIGSKRALLAVYRDEGRPTSLAPSSTMAWSSDGTLLRCFATGSYVPYINLGDLVTVTSQTGGFSFTSKVLRVGRSNDGHQGFDVAAPSSNLAGLLGTGTYQSTVKVNFYEDYVIFRSLPDFRVLDISTALALLQSWQPTVRTGFEQLVDPVTGSSIKISRKPFFNATTPAGQLTPSLNRQQFNEQNKPLIQNYDAHGQPIGSKLRYSKNQNSKVFIEADHESNILRVYDYYGFALNDVSRQPYLSNDLITFDPSMPSGIRRKGINGVIAYEGLIYDEFGLPVIGALDTDQLTLRDPVMPLMLDQFNLPRKQATLAAEPPKAVAILAPFASQAAPTNSVLPAIDSNILGQLLAASQGTWLNATSFTYRWYVNSTLSHTGQTYTIPLLPQNVGLTVNVQVTGTGSGGSTTVTTSDIVLVAHASPLNNTVPVITGAAQVGQTLSVGGDTWYYGVSSRTYQWYRNTTPITGETGATYLIADPDVGTQLKCVVTALNTYGSTQATTAQTATVAGVAFTPAALPNLLGWYDASNASSLISAASLVSSWHDLSGNNNHLVQSVDANKLATGMTTVNGHNVLTSSNGWMSFTTPMALGATSQYLFLAASNDSGSEVVFLVTDSSNSYAADIVPSGLMYDNIGAHTLITPSSTNIFSIMTSNVSPSAREIRFNNSITTDNSIGARTFISIGNYVTGSNNINGRVGELIIGNGALTPTQINTVMAYLKAKWGTP